MIGESTRLSRRLRAVRGRLSRRISGIFFFGICPSHVFLFGFASVLFLASAFFKHPEAKPKLRIVSIATLLSDLERFHGKTVTLRGRIRAFTYSVQGTHRFSTQGPICTEQECGPQSCCQSCYTPASLADDPNLDFGVLLQGAYKGKPLGCAGNECSLDCNPALDSLYLVTGVLSVQKVDGQGYRQAILKVYKITKIESK